MGIRSITTGWRDDVIVINEEQGCAAGPRPICILPVSPKVDVGMIVLGIPVGNVSNANIRRGASIAEVRLSMTGRWGWTPQLQVKGCRHIVGLDAIRDFAGTVIIVSVRNARDSEHAARP